MAIFNSYVKLPEGNQSRGKRVEKWRCSDQSHITAIIWLHPIMAVSPPFSTHGSVQCSTCLGENHNCNSFFCTCSTSGSTFRVQLSRFDISIMKPWDWGLLRKTLRFHVQRIGNVPGSCPLAISRWCARECLEETWQIIVKPNWNGKFNRWIFFRVAISKLTNSLV